MKTTEHKSNSPKQKIINLTKAKIYYRNVGNRNGPDLGQVLQNTWWIESDFTVRKWVQTDSSAFQFVEVCP